MGLPVLPTLPVLPVVQSAASGDALGNLYNANGYHIGVVPGSQADIGGAGQTVTPFGNPPGTTPTPTPVQPAQNQNDPTWGGTIPGPSPDVPWEPGTPDPTVGSQVKQAAGQATGGLLNVAGWIMSTRFAFFVIGLMMIGGGLYMFKTTQTVIDTATRASKAAASLMG